MSINKNLPERFIRKLLKFLSRRRVKDKFNIFSKIQFRNQKKFQKE
jgi:hypothetical protein